MSGNAAFTASEPPIAAQHPRHSARMVNAPLPKYGCDEAVRIRQKRLTKPRGPARSAKLASMLKESAVDKIRCKSRRFKLSENSRRIRAKSTTKRRSAANLAFKGLC
jgi:hypothetical protein